ncbi:MAG: DUF4476 domain-containing protein [Flavobacteriales bacterium]
MKRSSSLAFALALPVIGLLAQTSDLVFFADDGAEFTLIIDGDRKNMDPASRVVATGIRTESPVVVISFADGNIPELHKPGYFPLGKEYTVMITTNKKGQKVLRPTGEAALGTSVKTGPSKMEPTDFVADEEKPTSTSGNVTTTGSGGQTTRINTAQEAGAADDHVNMNVGIDVNGVGVDMNVNVTEGTRSSTTTTSTAATTNATTAVREPRTAKPATTAMPQPVDEPVYSMPGYTGAVGCPWPINDSEFGSMKGSIESKTFEESKMTMAKQILKDRCMKVSQVKGIMGLFTFEDSKLDFAKYAYDRTYDIGNYYQVNDLFTFEASIEELNQYLESK